MNNTIDYNKILRIFDLRYAKKKATNIGISMLIVILGVSSFLYGLRLEPSATIFRFMTVDGTVFTTVGALIYIIVNLVEVSRKTELTNNVVYYIRLSSAVAETVILIVVLFSQLPFFSEHLQIADRYDSFAMHILIPLLGVSSFVTNDSPIGRLSARRLWHGTWFITCYAATVMLLIGTGVLPHDLIPYFFMDLANNSVFLSLFAFAFIYGAAYFASWMLSELNRRGSWLWFRDLTKPRKSLR